MPRWMQLRAGARRQIRNLLLQRAAGPHPDVEASLREWLNRKQRESPRGRAELRLAERSALWNAKPENRFLPSVSEWVRIRSLTKAKDWTAPQARMMRRAGTVHLSFRTSRFEYL